MKRLVILICFQLFFQTGCLPGKKCNIEFPILLVHGLGGAASVWEDYGLIDFFKRDMGLEFGGIIEPSMD